MQFTPDELRPLADRLWNARKDVQQCTPLTETHPDLDLEGAYWISTKNFYRRCSEDGARPIGKKIGLTSEAVQKQLGVNEPDFGFLSDDMQVLTGGEIETSRFLQLKAEGEVAFRLRVDLGSEHITPEIIRKATDYVCVAIEVIDSRVRDWKIHIQDTIADNASSALFVLGEQKVKMDEIDLVKAKMKLTKNGEVVSRGEGSACLGDPCRAVAWLANKMNDLGTGLKAGDWILSGAYGPVVDVVSGDHCEVEIEGLGKASCRFK